MDEIADLIRRRGLQQDQEHVIIPLPGSRRCFLLKRPFIRVVYPDGEYADFPIAEVIEAVIRYPDISLREALALLHRELDAEIEKIFEEQKKE